MAEGNSSRQSLSLQSFARWVDTLTFTVIDRAQAFKPKATSASNLENMVGNDPKAANSAYNRVTSAINSLRIAFEPSVSFTSQELGFLRHSAPHKPDQTLSRLRQSVLLEAPGRKEAVPGRGVENLRSLQDSSDPIRLDKPIHTSCCLDTLDRAAPRVEHRPHFANMRLAKDSEVQ
jgi:hypothetical protein